MCRRGRPGLRAGHGVGMAHFFQLRHRLDEVGQDYFTLTQAASDNLAQEVAAGTRVQSVFRASKVREVWHAILASTHRIQRVVRGWLARVRMKALRSERGRSSLARFFNHCAATIQRFFRGCSSRRHLHDFYGRKSYLRKVATRGAWTTEYLQREYQVKVAESKSEEETQMRREFDTLAGELHHLVSTKSIAGVYNPPYNDALPRAFDKPIEQHLRDACHVQLPRSLRRPRHRVAIASSSPRRAPFPLPDQYGATPPQDLPDRLPHGSRSASVGRMQKIQGPFRSKEQIEVSNAKANNLYRSVQASVPYYAVEHDQRMQSRLEKLTRVSPADFIAPGVPPEKPPPSSVHASVPYRERPVELRGDYVELPKIRDKPPFFTALPRDRHFEDYQEQLLLPSGHA